MTPAQKQLEAFRRGNKESGRIYASDPEKFAGVYQELAERWLKPAESVTDRLRQRAQADGLVKGEA
jgi:hypothetical protein